MTTIGQEHCHFGAGALVFEAMDEKLGLSEQLADRHREGLPVGKIRQVLFEFVQQRMFAVALGYPDGNDAGELADEPMCKMLILCRGTGWPSQATVWRFEKLPGANAS